jgi:hypothetical protein
MTNTVELLELRVNEAQPVAQFELQFPPGTIVGDARNGKYYLIQADESMREVSATGDTELPGAIPQPGAPWYQVHQWLIAGIALFLALVAISCLVRKWRTRAG